ncbi:hypothetical protein GB937_010771 [Aspergillus fischeri]|nr:hypothetical protein GB937_010771 [Aspergillus fischeri]
MAIQISPSILGVAACVLFAVAACVYRALLPKPIPGIPYNKASANRILGDAPDLLKWRAETKEIWSYIRKLAVELDSPVIQMFMRPFGKPWVIVTDFCEAQDIQINRQHEFDRSTYIGEVFGPLLPGNHIAYAGYCFSQRHQRPNTALGTRMPSNDEFRAHRHLIRDTMSPSFLHDVVGPAIHSSTQDLLALWRERARLAQGRPFEADQDIIRNLVDVILVATFGFEVGAIASQTKLISGINKIDLPWNVDVPAIFPTAKDPQAFTSVRTLVDSLQIALRSPVPRQRLTFALKFYPSLVSARRWNKRMMVKSAVDLLVQREAQMAKRQNRDVMYDTRVIRDELFGFFSAGHETTSTTICWAVKYLTDHQEVQQTLRSSLKLVHKRAAESGELPTAQEIVKADIPYLDAFIEENHRLGNSIPTVIRITTRDTVVLGHRIPKGTDVFMLTNGPSFQTPAFAVNESARSKTSQESKDKYGVWDASDIERFRPERWLVKDHEGNLRFNPRAGPVLPYGLGPRGCFGIKLAVLELKVIITLIVWSFELQKTPPSLSGFGGDDMNTYRAQQVYLRLVEAK